MLPKFITRHATIRGSGRWFDEDAADRYEDTWWNGSNSISKATGSQWRHQKLCRTTSGNWILHSWSQVQGETENYLQIKPEQACSWLVQNGHDVPEDLSGEAGELQKESASGWIEDTRRLGIVDCERSWGEIFLAIRPKQT